VPGIGFAGLTNGYGSSSEAPAYASDGASVPRRQVSPA